MNCPDCDGILFLVNHETVAIRDGIVQWYSDAESDSYLKCEDCAHCFEYSLDDGETVTVKELRIDILP